MLVFQVKGVLSPIVNVATHATKFEQENMTLIIRFSFFRLAILSN